MLVPLTNLFTLQLLKLFKTIEAVGNGGSHEKGAQAEASHQHIGIFGGDPKTILQEYPNFFHNWLKRISDLHKNDARLFFKMQSKSRLTAEDLQYFEEGKKEFNLDPNASIDQRSMGFLLYLARDLLHETPFIPFAEIRKLYKKGKTLARLWDYNQLPEH